MSSSRFGIITVLGAIVVLGTGVALALLMQKGPRPRGKEGGYTWGTSTAVKPLHETNQIELQFTASQRFGINCPFLKDPENPEKPKRLCRDERGLTNNTVVRIEGHEFLYGTELAGAGARWLVDNGKRWKEIRVAPRKWVSIMEWETERIRVTQTVEIVVGEQTRLYDTALVTYEIENRDSKTHSVGLRAMLDTYIGANDGVPFFIPPRGGLPGTLVDTMMAFDASDIPEFIRALESDKLDDPTATVAEMGLRLKGLEPIEHMRLCRWPQEYGASEARWDWCFQAMNDPSGSFKDSCVALYWAKATMQPGVKRTMGYTYGLGRISTASMRTGGGRIRLFSGPGKLQKPFAVTAYIKGPSGQDVTLQLPPGLELVAGQAAKQKVPVPAAGRAYTAVSWLVRTERPGTYLVKADLNGRVTVEEEVIVRERGLFDGH